MDAVALIGSLEVDGPVAARTPAGDLVGELHSRRLAWDCADAPLAAQLLATEAFDPPPAEASEPVAAAIARLVRWAAARGAVLALTRPGTALGEARMPLAQGVRLVGIARDEDERCWDAALSLGLPLYGLRGDLRLDLSGSRRRDAGAVLLALAYGLYTCGEGLQPHELQEDRAGVSWHFERDDVQAAVIVKGGFEAAVIDGARGAWRDRGSEGYVRIAFTAGDGRCWSQPRLVVPTGQGTPHG